MSCLRCNRPLRDPESIRRGMGPVCAAKMAAESAGRESEGSMGYLNVPVEGNGFVLTRGKNGKVLTNVPHIVTHHSPTGFEWGYGGSGPADLALNIVECVLHRIGFKGDKMKFFEGECFNKAYELHQEFKWEFIAGVPRDGGTIDLQQVERWVKERI